MSPLVDIQSSDWDTVVASEDKPVMVEYWHHKCATCIEMKPIYEAQPSNFPDLVFTRMNLLESKDNRRFAINNGVRSTPTFAMYCKGTPVGTIIGQRTADEFMKEIEDLLGKTSQCLAGTPLEE